MDTFEPYASSTTAALSPDDISRFTQRSMALSNPGSSVVFPSRPFPARPPHISRNSHRAETASITSSLASSTASSQPYLPPPNLSTLKEPSRALASLANSAPRSARVDYTPPIPAAAQWLLLTTPPPPARARTNSFLAAPVLLETVDTRSTTGSDEVKSSWGRKGLAALGLGSRKSSTVSLASTLRPEPAPVKLQLRGPRRGGRLDSHSDSFEAPRTWEEYAMRYGRGEVNVEDPPFPPITKALATSTSAAKEGAATPYDENNYPAPASPLEHVRQKLLGRLDLLGKGDTATTAASGSPVPPVSSPMHVGSSSSSRISASTHADSLFSNNRRDSGFSTAPSSVFSHSAASGKSPLVPAHLHFPRSSNSFQNHPALHAILNRSKSLFNTKMTLITILGEQHQVFLASAGMPENVESLPRNATFCSHTVLNGSGGEKGLVVLDTQKDWRFRNNVLSVVMNARFYAGMPIFAPSHPDLEEEAGGSRLPIGTICIIDDQSRLEFSLAERAQLRGLAAEASQEIESWVTDRRSSVASFNSAGSYNNSKQVVFDSSASYINWQTTSSASKEKESRRGRSAASLPPTPPASIHRRPSMTEDRKVEPTSTTGPTTTPPTSHAPNARPLATMPEEASLAPSRPARSNSRDSRRSGTSPVPSPLAQSSHVFPSKPAAPKPTFPSQKTRAAPKSAQQKLFDAATRALAKGLDLSLVYLVSLDLEDSKTAVTLLSSHNLPTRKPSFDPALHLKALRAAEGGLLYRNPLVDPKDPMGFSGPGFASGILLPVAEANGRGWVLAGFTKDGSREFDEEELEYFVKVVEQLAKVVGWANKAEVAATKE